MTTAEMIDLGWCEWLSLPELDIPMIAAKIDTGARTSCIHAFSVEPFQRDGHTWLRIGIHPLPDNDDVEIWRELPAVDQRTVRDSGGHEEQRWVVRSSIGIGDQQWPADITLTNRDAMQFRMLLGRSAMGKAVRVNPGRKYLLGKPTEAELAEQQRVWQSEN